MVSTKFKILYKQNATQLLEAEKNRINSYTKVLILRASVGQSKWTVHLEVSVQKRKLYPSTTFRKSLNSVEASGLVFKNITD